MYNGKTWTVVVHTFHVKCFQAQHSYNLQYQINYKKRHFVFVDGCKIVTFVRVRCHHCRRLSVFLLLPEYNFPKLKNFFGNKHCVTLKHPSVLVSYHFINKTRRCLFLWLPEGSRPRGTCTQQFADRRQLSNGPSIFKYETLVSQRQNLNPQQGIVPFALMTWQT